MTTRPTKPLFRIDENVTVDNHAGFVTGSRWDEANRAWIYNVFRPNAPQGQRDIEALEENVRPVAPRLVTLTSKKGRRWTGIAVCNDGRTFEAEDIRKGDAMASAYYAAQRAGVVMA